MTLQSNITKLYFITALQWFMVLIPVIVLFYQENGLTLQEIFILQAFFSLIIVVFEIPSGYFGDVMSRKYSLLTGSILAFLGYLVYSISYGFWGFLGAEFLLGLGASFISGSDSAMLYDSLVELEKENKYKKYEGYIQSVKSLSEGIASILGGFIAVISLRYTIYTQAIFLFLAIPLAFTLKEPKRQVFDNSEGNLKSIMKIVKYSVHDHAEVKWLIIYSALIGASTFTVVWFIQPYFKLVGLPLAMFGIIWALLQFSISFFSLFAHKYEEVLGRKLSLISLVYYPVLGFILVGIFQNLWAIVFIFLFYFTRAIQEPILKDYIHKLIPSEIRATVLSVRSLAMRIIFVIVGPYVGWIADVYTLSMAFYMSAGFFFVFGSIALLFLHKNKAI